MNDSNFMTYEETAQYLKFLKEDGSPDIESVKRFLRKYGVEAGLVVKIGDENSRNRLVDKTALDNFLNKQKSINIAEKPNPPTDDLAKINSDIETMEKSKVLHQKTLEYNALRANFKTAEEYQQSLDNLKSAENMLKETTAELTDWETTLKAREIAIKDKEDTIESVCNEKLTEAENKCDNMIAETQKECDQMKAQKKVEVKKQENSEFDDMEWAVHQFEQINATIHQYGYSNYGEQIDVMINRTIEALNSDFTLQDLWQDFKYIADMVCEVIEATQNRKDTNQFINFRNQVGYQVNQIIIRLHLDDGRRGQKQTPALPSG